MIVSYRYVVGKRSIRTGFLSQKSDNDISSNKAFDDESVVILIYGSHSVIEISFGFFYLFIKNRFLTQIFRYSDIFSLTGYYFSYEDIIYFKCYTISSYISLNPSILPLTDSKYSFNKVKKYL